MHNSTRLLATVALSAAALSLAQSARAQDATLATDGGTILSVGGGAQLLQLPDINFTFLTSPGNGAVIHKQTNSDLDDYGGAINGTVETPLGWWGGTRVTGVVSGFWANVQDTDRKNCVSSANAICTVENIIDTPGPDSATFPRFTTKTDRDVDFWGVNGEARFGSRPAPLPDSGGYLFHFGYVGIGTDVRGIDQDNRLRLDAPGAGSLKYTETLDTTYWGGFISIGGEYNILGYISHGSFLGLRSFVTLKGGIYDANTDYNGKFAPPGFTPTKLGLSDDQVAFIGSASFETRKQFGPRTSLSLLTDYEWYSYAPQMRYVDADVGCAGPGTNCAGGISRTHISDDDAFAVRTTLRLNIGLGPTALYPAK